MSESNEPALPPMTEGPVGSRWLSIQQASAFLGVEQSTLRRWTDAGRVRAFRTPGGHRRYVEDDLRRFVGAGPDKPERPLVSRQALTDRSLSAYEDAFWREARDRRWFHAYTGAGRDEFRLLGRRLVDLAVRYASAPGTIDRSELVAEGRRIGALYGRFGVETELSGAEAVEVFLYFRLPVIRSVAGMIEEQKLPAKQAARLFGEIGQFMDQVLIAMMRAFESLE